MESVRRACEVCVDRDDVPMVSDDAPNDEGRHAHPTRSDPPGNPGPQGFNGDIPMWRWRWSTLQVLLGVVIDPPCMKGAHQIRHVWRPALPEITEKGGMDNVAHAACTVSPDEPVKWDIAIGHHGQSPWQSHTHRQPKPDSLGTA
jgi:hypothetical protein